MKEPNIHDELKDIAPGLSKIKPGEGYSVPPVYFKELQDKVMGQIHSEERQAPVGNWLRDLLQQYFTPRYALALGIVAMAIVATVVFTNQENDGALLASITAEDAFEYVYSNIDEYETSDLYALGGAEYTGNILDEMSDEDLDSAIDALIDDLGAESFEQLY